MSAKSPLRPLLRSSQTLFQSAAVPLLLAVVALIWLVFALYGGPTIYHGGDELGPLSRWPDRYRAAWTRPLPVEPRIVSRDGDLSLGDRSSEMRINRAADEVDPSVTPGGDRLLFASNRSDAGAFEGSSFGSALGGFDLYIAARDGEGFGDPVLLPAPLSTVFQERSPSLALLPDGSARLLFTSNRLHGLATDFDLFLAMRGRDGEWQAPVLLDILSTGADERGAAIHPEGDSIVFSRPESRGLEYFESYRRSDGTWSDPERLRALRHPDNGAMVRFDEGGNALLFERNGQWFRSRLRILREIPTGGTPWGAWILLALALLLLLLRAMASRWSGLEILYRCLLVSILIHLLLWWWLADRGIDAPDPIDAGPPASEIAPIELDPELFARANEPAAQNRAHGEEVTLPEFSVASEPSTSVESLPSERAALSAEIAATRPAEREEVPLASRMRDAAQTEPLPEPSRAETEIDASEFELASDPGRNAEEAESAVTVESAASRLESQVPASESLAERAAHAGSLALTIPAERAPAPRTESATDPDPAEVVTRQRVAVESLEVPARDAPRAGSAPTLAEAAEPTEAPPTERAAPLSARPGERASSEAEPTPRPTRVRPGPTPADRPAAELARIEGAVAPVTPGGAVAPAPRARPMEPRIQAESSGVPALREGSAPAESMAESSFADAGAASAGRATTRAEFARAGSSAAALEAPAPRATLPGDGTTGDGTAGDGTAGDGTAGDGTDSGENGASPVVARGTASSNGLAPPRRTRGKSSDAPSSAEGAATLADGTSDRAAPTQERDLARLAPVSSGPSGASGNSGVPERGPITRTLPEPAGKGERTLPRVATSGAHPAIEPGVRASSEREPIIPRRRSASTATELASASVEGGNDRAEPRAARGAPVRAASIAELSLDPLPALPGVPPASGGAPGRLGSSREIASLSPAATLQRIGSTVDDSKPVIVTRVVERDDDWVPWVSARRGPRKEEALRRGGGTEETEAAVRAGLAYLAAKQRDHGGWGDARSRHQKYGETSVGRTALSLLAFLGAGHAPTTETEYSDVTAQAIDFLIGSQRERTGHFGSHTSSYSHAISTYALGEAVLMGVTDARIRRALERGVEQILRNQELDEDRPAHYGGWSYFYPDGHRFDDYPRVSITVWQLMALETALLAGVDLPKARVALGKAWILAQWSGELGRYYYTRNPEWTRRRTPTLPGSTPAAAFILEVLGHDEEDERLADAIDMVSERPPRGWSQASTERFLSRGEGNTYFWYYGTLALFLHGGSDWDRWNGALQRTLLPSQEDDGSWEPIDPYSDYAGDTNGERIYTTAINVLTLEVYYRYLTPFQQKVAGDRK